jgi:hypothetical protein
LRSNLGGEFTSTAFNFFYEEPDIRRHLTAPYSSQQNGVAKHKNQTILDMVRNMLKSKNMPKEFWAETVDCVVYLLNRCKRSSLENVTPQEAWSGLKPTVSHLKVFDSVAYVHIPDQRHVKLDDKSLKLIFVGYDERSKSYIFFDPTNKKIHISRDVHVNEEVMWDWSAMKETFHEKAPEMHSPVNIPSNNHEEVPPTTHDASSSDDEARPLKIRSIRDLYETTSELHLVCFLA